jgi:hypothetical protein
MGNFNYKKYLRNNPLLSEGEQKVVVRHYDREKEELVVAYRGTDFDKAVEVKNELLKRFPEDDVMFNYDYRGEDDDKGVDVDSMAFNVSKGLFEGKKLFHYTIPKNEFGMTRMVIKAKDREEADKKIAAEYPDGGYEYKGTGAKFKYESINEGSLDSIFGGIPYKTVGTKSFTTTYIPDDVKERIIGRAKEAGKIAQPNVNGGVTVFQTAVSEIELKYRSEDYILDYIANDLFREKYGRTISFNELTDDEQDKVENSYDSYIDEDEPSGFYDKGMGVDE